MNLFRIDLTIISYQSVLKQIPTKNPDKLLIVRILWRRRESNSRPEHGYQVPSTCLFAIELSGNYKVSDAPEYFPYSLGTTRRLAKSRRSALHCDAPNSNPAERRVGETMAKCVISPD